MSDSVVYVVQDDWGYDGIRLIDVAATLDLAKQVASDDFTERMSGGSLTPPTEWREINADGIMTVDHQWRSSVDPVFASREYVIIEKRLVTS